MMVVGDYTVPRAERLVTARYRLLDTSVDPTIRGALLNVLGTLWAIEGHPGLWSYGLGVGLAETVAPEGCVVADNNGRLAIFEREVAFEQLMRVTMGVNGIV